MLLSLYACKSANPEDLFARILGRKYVLIFHIQLDDRSRVAVATGVVKIIVKMKFPKKMFSARELTGLQSGTPLATPLLLQKRRPWFLDGT